MTNDEQMNMMLNERNTTEQLAGAGEDQSLVDFVRKTDAMLPKIHEVDIFLCTEVQECDNACDGLGQASEKIRSDIREGLVGGRGGGRREELDGVVIVWSRGDPAKGREMETVTITPDDEYDDVMELIVEGDGFLVDGEVMEINDFIKLFCSPKADQFDRVWKQIEVHGGCDGIGGAEYKRVHGSWIESGRPMEDLPQRIYREANEPPFSKWAGTYPDYLTEIKV